MTKLARSFMHATNQQDHDYNQYMICFIPKALLSRVFAILKSVQRSKPPKLWSRKKGTQNFQIKLKVVKDPKQNVFLKLVT